MNRRIAFGIVLASLAYLAPTPAASALPVCKSGFVLREAYRNDPVCVTPATRKQVRADNAAAAGRVQPNGAYGPNTCKPGWVWRTARPRDLVCVAPAQRTQARADNALAAVRVARPRGNAIPSTPIVALGADGNPLAPGASNLAECRLGGAQCPARYQPAYDEVSLSCLCRAD